MISNNRYIFVNPKGRLGKLRQPIFIDPLVQATHTSPEQLSKLITEKANLTPSLAHSLVSYFGMSPDFWLNLQTCWDLYHERRRGT